MVVEADLLADPFGVAFRPSSSEVFIGNRHGNASVDGVAGSVSRFIYDPEENTFTPSGEITGNSLSAVHEIAFSPTTGELFAANNGGGISRFTFDGDGDAVANGVIGTEIPFFANGYVRGVGIAPDGMRLFATNSGNILYQYDLTTGEALPSVTVSQSAQTQLSFMAWRDGDLYLGSYGDSTIYRFSLDADDEPTLVDTITASSPTSVAFSPDGLTMFATNYQLLTDVGALDTFAFVDGDWGAPVATTTPYQPGILLQTE